MTSLLGHVKPEFSHSLSALCAVFVLFFFAEAIDIVHGGRVTKDYYTRYRVNTAYYTAAK